MDEHGVSRFAVPFGYDAERYDEWNQALRQAQTPKGQPKFVPRKLQEREHQFFPFFSDGIEPDNHGGIGTLWKLALQKEQIMGGRIFYRKSTQKSPYIRCIISAGGVAMFKTGVGIAWFQMELEHWPNFPSEAQKRPATVAEMVDVNNYCKDICHRTLRPTKEVRNKAGRLVRFRGRPYDENQEPETDAAAEEFFLFDWLWELLFSPLPEGAIHFFSPRMQEGAIRKGPDKAHIFSAITRDMPNGPEEEAENWRQLYWLRKGYRPSYRPAPKDLDPHSPEVLQTFENVVWTACFEGCAMAVYHTGFAETDKVFDDHHAHTVDCHFILYLTALAQYYTLQVLSARMAQMPCHVDQFSDAEQGKLVKIQEELGEAYSKIFYPRVSYIGHQNLVYDLFRQALDIRLLQEELTQKTKATLDILSSYRARKRDRLAQIISIISGVFVVIQVAGTILSIHQMEPALAGMNRWGFVGTCMLVALAVGCFVSCLRHRGKRGNYGTKKEKQS